MEINFLFSLAVLILSIIVHEISHGYAALFLGDPTAKYANRLTLNPLPHIDIIGSVIVPIFTIIIPGGLVFGWAKPVPINPYNLKWGKWGEAVVAFAGPASNLILSFVASIFIRLGVSGRINMDVNTINFLSLIVLLNIVLALFNLMPVPPLDGSKVAKVFVPRKFYGLHAFLERGSFIMVLLFLFVIWRFIEPIIPWMFRLMTGIAF